MEEDRHGSAIARDVLDRTDGARRLWPATLYRTLDDLAQAGLIRELTGSELPEGVAPFDSLSNDPASRSVFSRSPKPC